MGNQVFTTEKRVYKKVQILGLGPHYVPVVYDILIDNDITNVIEIFKNLDKNIKPVSPTFEFPYKISESNKSPDKDFPCVLGVSGAENKIPVLQYFKDNHGISEENFITVTDRSACISSSVKMDMGCFIEQNVSISSQTSIGFGVSIKRNASVGHHCIIGNLVDINPGAVISGRVSIADNCTIGSGAILIDGIKIGKNTFVGAGSVVTKDLPEGVVAYGNPCKVIRSRSNF